MLRRVRRRVGLVVVLCIPLSIVADLRAGNASGVTVDDRSAEAYGQPLPGLAEEELRHFAFGNRLFETNWVIAPASVSTLDGLGPLYNRTSCAGCHVRDGRGRPPAGPNEPSSSVIVRVVLPGVDEHGGSAAHPHYGLQIQDRAIDGVTAEARIVVDWIESAGRYPDGAAYTLRQPKVTLADPAYGPLEEGVGLSLRVAPATFGVGLLEAVPVTALTALADEGDANGDGVSGRVNRVWDRGAGDMTHGRFGWKASQPSVRRQITAALARDIGITSADDPTTDPAPSRPPLPLGGDVAPEISEPFLEQLVFYTETLAVPAPRDADDPAVVRGSRLFSSSGCAACHVPSLPIGEHPALHRRVGDTIAAYTDLLLHDMGSGLADGAREYGAGASEWRTPPLWGIGLVSTVNRHSNFLHDGRARNLEEAVLWHGGEADRARATFLQLPPADRAALLTFLESL